MPTLKTAPLDTCFYLGWHLRRVDSAIALRSFPGSGDELDWRADRDVHLQVSMASGFISRTLASYVLSIPASRRLQKVTDMVFRMRSTVSELKFYLIRLDLARSPERVRWMVAGWLLEELELLERSGGSSAARVLVCIPI